jgi:PAS domain S-box-containing protein
MNKYSVIQSVWQNLLNSGAAFAPSISERRNVVLTNYVSFVSLFTSTLLLIARLFFQTPDFWGNVRIIGACLLFVSPVFLNRAGFIFLSRVVLCWVPSAFVLFTAVIGLSQLSVYETSTYVGLRLFLVSFFCFPFLVFNTFDYRLLILGLLGPSIVNFLYDPILTFFGVGYLQKGLHDPTYGFNNVRTIVSALTIGSSSYFLKRVIEKSDATNESLIGELEQKNALIQEQTAFELSELDKKLLSEQKQAQLSDAMFKSAFVHSAIGMALTAINGRLIKVNDQLCKITEYSTEELLAGNVSAFSHPDEIDEDDRLAAKCLHGEIETYEREKRHIRKSGSIGWIKVAVSLVREADGKPLYFVRQIEDISERKIAEQEKEKARYLLNERMKELTTLYKIGQILQNEEKPINESMQEIALLLPPGWQYPEITAGRILVGETEYKTPNYSKGVARQQAEFYLPHGVKGLVEVVYLVEKPQEVEGPFLIEERNLINMLADMLRIYFAKRQESLALKSSEANLAAILNNTDVMIWSVDRDLNVTAFNKPLEHHIKKYYGIDAKIGVPALPESNDENVIESNKQWRPYYQRALNGERILFENVRFDRVLQYTLGPIIESDSRITGVNVYATDITEQKRSAEELAEANKKIGELKLMALRSVMNPHFVFNVLNSIQFFIANNDRLNAINYLSTFSKLIRSILNHSVNNLVKISDEIDMLKNYIQLEQVRFDKKFDFVLEVDKTLEVDDIEVPSLLIQPYVENAILHGLNNKEGKGTLKIKVSEEEEAVLFEIEDDGIGRKAALKLREQNFPSHKSMGIKLTEERLKLINEHRNVSFEVIDLENGQGPCGTKVRIWVRL